MPRLPDQLTRPMTPTQATMLHSLSVEAYQPKQFAEDLSGDEAERRISALKAEIELANSF
jgi:Protein of unknown function (DUF3072)